MKTHKPLLPLHLLFLCLSSLPAYAIWNGSGVNGGTGGNRFDDVNNWASGAIDGSFASDNANASLLLGANTSLAAGSAGLNFGWSTAGLAWSLNSDDPTITRTLTFVTSSTASIILPSLGTGGSVTFGKSVALNLNGVGASATSTFTIANTAGGTGAATPIAINGSVTSAGGLIVGNSTGGAVDLTLNGNVSLGRGYGTGNPLLTVGNGSIAWVNGKLSYNGSQVASDVISNSASTIVFTNDTNDFGNRINMAGASLTYFTSIADKGTASALGTGAGDNATAGLNLNNSSLIYIGGQNSSSNRVVAISNTGYIYNYGTGSLTLTGRIGEASTTNATTVLGGIDNGSQNIVSGSITDDNTVAGGGMGISKVGSSTWVLSGANHLDGNGTTTITTGISVTSGKLIFDYATNDPLQTSTGRDLPLVLGSGTLEFKGKTGAGNTTTETISGTVTLKNNGLSQLTVNSNGGNSTALTLSTATTWTRSNNSYLLFDLSSANSAIYATAPSLVGGAGADANMLSGGYYTIKTSTGNYDFAALSGTSITRLNATTTLTSGANSTTTPYVLSGDLTLGSATVASTVRVDTSTTGGTLTLGANNLTLNNYSLLFDGVNDYTLQGTTGVIAQAATNSGATLYNYSSGAVNVNARLGVGTGSVFLIGDSNNLFVLGANAINSSGALGIYGSTVRVGSASALSLTTASSGAGTGNIILNNGGIIELASGDLTRNVGTGGGAVQFAGDGGFGAVGADRIVNLGNAKATLTWGSSSFVPDGNTLILSSLTSDAKVDFQNGINLNANNRVIKVNNGSATVDAMLSGVIIGASSGTVNKNNLGGIVKTGAGTLAITGINTYGGTTTVSEGTLLANTAVSGSNSATGTGSVVVKAGVFGGSGQVAPTGTNGISVASGAAIAPGASANDIGTLTINLANTTGGVTMDDGATFTFELGTAAVSLAAAGSAGASDMISLTGASIGDFTFAALGNTVNVTGGLAGYYKLFDTSLANATSDGDTWNNLTYDTSTGLVSAGLVSGANKFYVGTAANGGDLGDIYLQVVPEPNVPAMLIGGFGVLVAVQGMRRRRCA